MNDTEYRGLQREFAHLKDQLAKVRADMVTKDDLAPFIVKVERHNEAYIKVLRWESWVWKAGWLLFASTWLSPNMKTVIHFIARLFE